MSSEECPEIDAEIPVDPAGMSEKELRSEVIKLRRQALETNEQVARLRRGNQKLREHKERAYKDKPFTDLGRKIIAEREEKLWEEIRARFPDSAHQAANLAAHNWILMIHEDQLIIVGKRELRVLNGSKSEVISNKEAPRVCDNCAFSQRVDNPSGDKDLRLMVTCRASESVFDWTRCFRTDTCEKHQFIEE